VHGDEQGREGNRWLREDHLRRPDRLQRENAEKSSGRLHNGHAGKVLRGRLSQDDGEKTGKETRSTNFLQRFSDLQEPIAAALTVPTNS
jgi:hypothetical protein